MAAGLPSSHDFSNRKGSVDKAKTRNFEASAYLPNSSFGASGLQSVLAGRSSNAMNNSFTGSCNGGSRSV